LIGGRERHVDDGADDFGRQPSVDYGVFSGLRRHVGEFDGSAEEAGELRDAMDSALRASLHI
jgi:hypothetical protein